MKKKNFLLIVLMILASTMINVSAATKKQAPAKSAKSKDTNMILMYLSIQKKLIKDPYEKAEAYNSRIEQLEKEQNLNFSITLNNINTKYNPEDETLSIEQSDPYFGVNTLATPVNFTGCANYSPQTVIMLGRLLKIDGCYAEYGRSIIISSWMFDNKRGIIIPYSSKSGTHMASNSFGAKVRVEESEVESILLSPDDAFWDEVLNAKIPSNIKYAKANKSVKVKLVGRVIEPKTLEYGLKYNEATMTDPYEDTRIYLGMKVQITNALLVDSTGKEIALKSEKAEEVKLEGSENEHQ